MSVLLDALKKAALEKQKRDKNRAVDGGGNTNTHATKRDRSHFLSDAPDTEESYLGDSEEDANSDFNLVENDVGDDHVVDGDFDGDLESDSYLDSDSDRIEMPIDIDEADLEDTSDSVPTLEHSVEDEFVGDYSDLETLDESREFESEDVGTSNTDFDGELSEELMAAPDAGAANKHTAQIANTHTPENHSNIDKLDDAENVSQTSNGNETGNNAGPKDGAGSKDNVGPKDNAAKTKDTAPAASDASTSSKSNNASGSDQTSSEKKEDQANASQTVQAGDDSGKKNFVSDNRHSAEYFKQLLKSNQEDIKRRRKRFIVWFVLCGIVALAMAIAYYYINIVNYQAPRTVNPLSQSIENNLDEEGAYLADDTNAATVEENNVGNNNDNSSRNTESVASQESVTKSTPETKVVTKTAMPNANKPSLAPKKETKPVAKKTPSVSNKKSPIKQRIEVSEPTVDPLSLAINQGYAAYNRGEFDQAEEAYRRALSISSTNRDAILGMAAVASVKGQYENALVLYQRQLSQKPNDDYAHTGMLSILSVENISPELFSKVNELLLEFPDAAHLHFLKGRMLVKQSRWSAAQMSFFNAWSRSSDRADYAYNLAISLDNLGLPKEALTFYRKSMALAKENMFGVDVVAVRRRIELLEGASNE